MATTTHTNKVQYTCPMHTEIIRPMAGNCPICGMTLVPLDSSDNSPRPGGAESIETKTN